MARTRLPQLTAASTTEWMKAIALRSERLRELDQRHAVKIAARTPDAGVIHRQELQALFSQTEARWWIENEGKDLESLLKQLKASVVRPT